jgi:hypothetical protein
MRVIIACLCLLVVAGSAVAQDNIGHTQRTHDELFGSDPVYLEPSPGPVIRGARAGDDLVRPLGGVGSVRLGQIITQRIGPAQVGQPATMDTGSHDDLQYQPQ